MLQVNKIRENLEAYIEGLRKRGIHDGEQRLSEVISIDDSRKHLQQETDRLLAEANSMAKQIGILMKQGKGAEAEEIKKDSAELRTASKNSGEQLKEAESKLAELLYNIPNIPHASV